MEINKLTDKNIEEVLCNAYLESDEAAWEVFYQAKSSKSGVSRKATFDALDTICCFSEDSKHEKLAFYCQARVRVLTAKNLALELLEMGDSIQGMELSNSNGDLFLVFLKDASDQGCFRASYFDKNGFQGHSTRSSWETVVTMVVEDGYRKKTKVLEDLFHTSLFQRGMERAAEIQKIESQRQAA